MLSNIQELLMLVAGSISPKRKCLSGVKVEEKIY